ncbi:MAG TPA: hydrogenase small subunit [Candidatus Helicobacter avicola]|nr:hydrogenase small subunit [Candidatus Helicobacter avicola]
MKAPTSMQILEQKLAHRLDSVRQTRTKTSLVHLHTWVGEHLSLLGIPTQHLDMCVEILEHMSDMKIIWLHLQECSGCTESLLRTQNPSFETLLFDIFRIEYHDTLMMSSGYQATQVLESAVQNEHYILLVEGSVPMEGAQNYLTIGERNGYEDLCHIAQNAQAVFAIGTCSSYGGVQSAAPNPSRSHALSEVLNREVIHIPGCPPSDKNIIATLLYYYLFLESPALDNLHRPLWAYGKSVHDLCERKGAFLSGKFAQDFNDEGMQEGYCLYKVGCKGPYAFNNCPKVQFNAKTSWPVRAGHGCIACSEPNFWDNFGALESPMSKQSFFTYQSKCMPKPKNTPTLLSHSLKTREAKQEFLTQHNLSKCLFVESSPESSAMYLYADGALTQILTLNFETNPKLLLQSIQSKNKQGQSLYQNYCKTFGDNAAWIDSLEETSVMSANLYDALKSALMLFGVREANATDLLKLAKECRFPYVSPFGLKLKQESIQQVGQGERAIGYNWNFAKALSVALAYCVGGLDVYGLSYSLAREVVDMFVEVAKEQDCAVVFEGEIFTHFLVIESHMAHTTYLVDL